MVFSLGVRASGEATETVTPSVSRLFALLGSIIADPLSVCTSGALCAHLSPPSGIFFFYLVGSSLALAFV